MPLVAPDTFRVAVNGTYAGQPVANVIDFIPVLVSGALPDREDMGDLICERLGEAIDGSVVDSISNLVEFSGCTWVDLDSSLGSTGVYGGTPFPIVGANTGNPQPGNVSWRIIKSASGPRGSRTGSIYWPGVPEASTSPTAPNDIGSTPLADMNSRLATFMTILETPGTYGGAGSWFPGMVVTRTRDTGAGPEWVATSRVQGLTAQNRVASQRRRLDL